MVPALPPRAGKPASKADFDMEITGLVPGMAYHFAGCCHAVPGDAIVGIIATGKGVTIHARDCPTLEAFAATPERFIDVDWNHDALPRNGAGHTARVSVIAANVSSSRPHGQEAKSQRRLVKVFAREPRSGQGPVPRVPGARLSRALAHKVVSARS